MDNHHMQQTVLHGLLADEVNAVIEYVEYSATRDCSDHAELHQAMLEMYINFPTWLQRRVDFLERAGEAFSQGGITVLKTNAGSFGAGMSMAEP